MTKTILLLLVFGLLFFGCTAPPETSAPEQVEAPAGPGSPHPEPGVSPEPEPETAPEPEVPPEAPEDGTLIPAHPQGTQVLMTGRSVAYYWTEYMGLEWTCDDEECATGSPRGNYDDYYFIYYELEYPPDIARSAADAVDMYGGDAEVVFFKFCFVDFAADDSLQNAYDNEGLIEDVYQYVVVERGKKLIIGNALPQVRAHTEPALVANHREFNAWLDNFAATHGNVQVLDLNGMLTDSSGNLMSEYAVSADDSHLNSNGYARITPEFLELIESA
ncbi:MAG: hypothetical protein ABII71_04315 [Candidatus Micrarchaeota archaeon]